MSEALNTFALNLDDCFLVDKNDFPNGLRKDNLQLSLKMNPKTPLDKLISYCFYIKQPDIFYRQKRQTLEMLKYQIGKDVARDDRHINGKLYDKNYYINKALDENGNMNNIKVADMFYQNIIDHLYSIHSKIDLNIVNKIALLSCQNVYGLISDLITIQINDMLKPELSTIFKSDKHVDIIIQKEQLSMEYHFKSKLLITRDQEPFDPEYPCGQLEFILYIDILNNRYEIKQFLLNYDIDKCGPEQNFSLEKQKKGKLNLKPELVVPATGITLGMLATPILLATLGGKKRKTRRKIKKIIF